MSKDNISATQLVLKAPVAQVLWRLATPNVVAVTMLTAVTVADAWYVGQLGTAALASLALVFPFQTLMQMMAGGAIGGGITSAVGRALGAGAIERAESIENTAYAPSAKISGDLSLLTSSLGWPTRASAGLWKEFGEVSTTITGVCLKPGSATDGGTARCGGTGPRVAGVALGVKPSATPWPISLPVPPHA